MNDISTQDLLSFLIKKIYLIGFITFLIASLTSIVALNLQEIYRSEALLQISDSSLSSSPSSASVSSSAMGLASLAGLNLDSSSGSSNSKNPSYVTAKITSRSFFDHLASFPGVLENVFAHESFDFDTKKILYDDTVFNSKTNEWVRIPAGLRKSKPSSLEAHEVFLSDLTISVDKKTQFIYMTYDHSPPFFAKEILELIFKEINSLQKEQDLIQSTKELDYLTNLKSTNKLIYVEQSLSNLILKIINEQMLASVNDEYLVEYIDAPYVAESRIFPRRTSLVLSVTAVGFVITILSMLIFNFGFRSTQKNS